MSLASTLSAVVARTRTLPPVIRIACTVAVAALALLLRQVADPYLPAGYPFLTFFLAILLSAALFGGVAGLVATALSAALASWFYLAPLGTLSVDGRHHLLALALFVVIGATMTIIIEALHRSTERLRRAHDELRRTHEALRRTHEALLVSERSRALLLREFRHRTRNDLASLAGLLLLRARAAPSDAAREGLQEAADHARALARVHTRLAAGDIDSDEAATAAAVDTRDFVTGLCADLDAVQAGQGLRPVAIVARAEAHLLDTERAVQLGLVLNETVTNALKYAFPEEQAGTVRVDFSRCGDEFVLTVEDNGVGLPPEGEMTDETARAAGGLRVASRRPGVAGLGTRLLRALAAQLRGSFTRKPGPNGTGTVAELRFPT